MFCVRCTRLNGCIHGELLDGDVYAFYVFVLHVLMAVYMEGIILLRG